MSKNTVVEFPILFAVCRAGPNNISYMLVLAPKATWNGIIDWSLFEELFEETKLPVTDGLYYGIVVDSDPIFGNTPLKLKKCKNLFSKKYSMDLLECISEIKKVTVSYPSGTYKD